MTFVKIIFVLLILVPVAILMWNVVNRLITDFTEVAKESAEQERVKTKAKKENTTKEVTKHEKYREHNRGSHTERSDKEKLGARQTDKGAPSFKQMVEKRKRRKERRKQKDQEQKR